MPAPNVRNPVSYFDKHGNPTHPFGGLGAFHCRFHWPDDQPCAATVTHYHRKTTRSSYWCGQHAPPGAQPLDPVDLPEAVFTKYFVHLAKGRPWTRETFRSLVAAVEAVGTRRRIPDVVLRVLATHPEWMRPTAANGEAYLKGSTIGPPDGYVAPPEPATIDRRFLVDLAAAPPREPNGQPVAQTDAPGATYAAPDPEPGFDADSAVNRLLRDMRALLTAQHVRVESPEVKALKGELETTRAELAALRAVVAEAVHQQGVVERDAASKVKRRDQEIARLTAEVARLEADNLKLVEEGVALASQATPPPNEPPPVAERAPSPGAVAADLMRLQRNAEREAEAQRERERLAAAKAEARRMPEALKAQAVVVEAPAKPKVGRRPRAGAAAPRAAQAAHAHPLILALASVLANFAAKGTGHMLPVTVTARADKTWRRLPLSEREPIAAALAAWFSGNTARLGRIPSTHKIHAVLKAPHHLQCAKDWRVVLDRTDHGWDIYDLVQRSDRSVYSSEH